MEEENCGTMEEEDVVAEEEIEEEMISESKDNSKGIINEEKDRMKKLAGLIKE